MYINDRNSYGKNTVKINIINSMYYIIIIIIIHILKL